ncbi:MAG: rhomboid family intramembrane serine protease [Candidatus Eiseniibacteriota bacterium]
MSRIAGGPERTDVLVAFGANARAFVEAGEIWRLLASTFLHANELHLLVNAYALYLLGGNLEAFYGPWRLLFLYLVSGIAGSLASDALAERISVGASGAIFGLLGGSIVFAFRFRGVLPARVAKIMGPALLPWLGVNLALGLLAPRIDMNAHLGGLAGGAVVALFLAPRSLLPILGVGDAAVTRILPAVCTALLVVSFAGAFESIFRTRGPDGPRLDAWHYDAIAAMERDAALELVEERLAEAPDQRDLLHVRGRIRVEAEDWPGAIADFRRLAELDPRDFESRNNLAWILLEEAPETYRDRAEAERVAREALELAPEDPFVRGTYGTARLRAGDPAGAAEHLQAALAAHRDDEGAATDRYLLAIALSALGRHDEAQRELERATRDAPEDRYRAEAESALAARASQSEPAP